MQNKFVYVNTINEVQGMTFGHSTELATSCENLKIIYNQDLHDIFKKDTYKNGISRSFDKYCQYIFSVETTIFPEFNIIITFIDCHNNVDLALEFFMAESSSIDKEEKTRFMDLFNEISNDKNLEYATMNKNNEHLR